MSQRQRVPEALLEQLSLGELSAAEAEDVRRRLAEEPGGSDRLAALEALNEAILAELPPRVVAAEVERRVRLFEPRPSPRSRWVWAPLAAGALALVIALPFLLRGPIGPGAGGNPAGLQGGEPGIRLKGDPMLVIHRKHAASIEELAHGQRASRGDRLQLSYVSAWARYGVIYSIDGRGAVTLHFPRTAEHSAALAGGGGQVLPYSYELDDAPAFERFFFVASEEPIEAKDILAAEWSTDPRGYPTPVLAAHLYVTDFLLVKSEGTETNR